MGTAEKAIIAISLLGLAVTAYLILYHYSAVQLVCPNGGGAINCEKILNSSYSVVHGVPLPVIGFAFFIIELLFLRIKAKEPIVFLNALAVAVVVFLIYIEYTLGSICLWCTTVHILVIALFLVSLYRAK
ncbi:MAG: Vitamin K epoxide reductase [Candidatus Micrarchaeota archaeon]|nr:Vitamin K epoxide reductase [Candidatus Micrarchaeota archaeon]MDE1824451.1 Vitamin K epoxide reductase [Candidatus Micrarchaeota archaeon]MDE1849616.1 Vitamin K epoxide reductase [Candidatus Micrarchaeota archaeon]